MPEAKTGAMPEELTEMYETVRLLHQTFIELEEDLKKQAATKNLEWLANVAYALREANALLDDTGKSVRRVQGLCEKIACARWSRGEDLEPIRTEYCTAMPDLKTGVSLPQKDTPEFFQLLEYYGIPTELNHLVRFHWPTLVQEISESVNKGLPLPPGIDPGKTHDEFKLNIRRRKGVLE